MEWTQLITYDDGWERYHPIDISTFSNFMGTDWESDGNPNIDYGVQLGQILKG